MKNSTRVIAAISALLMLVGLVACSTPGQTTETTVPVVTGAQTDDLYDEAGYLLDDIPDELDYGLTEVSVLHWDSERPEFEIEQDALDGNIVEENIAKRNMRIEERLGVKLLWHEEQGSNSYRANFKDYVIRCYNSSEFYDVIATYSRTAGMLSQNGMLVDLNSIDNSYLNFEQPWWPETMLETCTIDDSLYFVSGDVSTNMLHIMYAIYYNTQMIADLQLEDPVQFVDNKTWTIDKLIEMTSDVYEDLDHNSKLSEGDKYGFCTIYYHIDAFYTGSNMQLVECDSEGNLVVSDDFTGEKSVTLVDKLGAWLTTENCFVSRSGASVNYYYPFVDGNALFCQNRVYMADDVYGSDNGHSLQDVSWIYGIVPTPLYDLEQENYMTVVGNPFTLYGIMTGAKNESMSSAVIECWASEGYRLTTPALFEINMKYKYAQEDKYSRMFDIIRETIQFDLGRIYSDQLSYMSEMPSKAATDGKSWTTMNKVYLTMIKKGLNSLNEDLASVKSKAS